jgi:hypothetical protein
MTCKAIVCAIRCEQPPFFIQAQTNPYLKPNPSTIIAFIIGITFTTGTTLL